MTTEEKLALAIEALEEIMNFGHAEECGFPFVSPYECGCYKKSQKEMAVEALEKMGEL